MTKFRRLAIVLLFAGGLSGCHTHGPNWLLGSWVLAMNEDGTQPDATCPATADFTINTETFAGSGPALTASYSVEDGKVYIDERSIYGPQSSSVYSLTKTGRMFAERTPQCTYIRAPATAP